MIASERCAPRIGRCLVVVDLESEKFAIGRAGHDDGLVLNRQVNRDPDPALSTGRMRVVSTLQLSMGNKAGEDDGVIESGYMLHAGNDSSPILPLAAYPRAIGNVTLESD